MLIPSPAVTRAVIAYLNESHMSARALARELGISHTALLDRLHRITRWRASEVADLIALGIIKGTE